MFKIDISNKKSPDFFEVVAIRFNNTAPLRHFSTSPNLEAEIELRTSEKNQFFIFSNLNSKFDIIGVYFLDKGQIYNFYGCHFNEGSAIYAFEQNPINSYLTIYLTCDAWEFSSDIRLIRRLKLEKLKI